MYQTFITLVLVYLLLVIIDIPYLYYTYNTYKSITYSISRQPYSSRYYAIVIVYLAITLGLMVYVLPKIDDDDDGVKGEPFFKES